MITKPPVTDYPTPNVFTEGAMPKGAIVCHIMDGTLAACDAWFGVSSSQVSANFGVGRDGAIHQYVDPESGNSPWANGLLSRPDADVERLCANRNNANPNLWTISIEHEGYSDDVLTDAQMTSTVNLIAWCCQRFNITNDRQHILGHYQFDSVTRSACPGWPEATYAAIINAVDIAMGTAVKPGPDIASIRGRLQSIIDSAKAALEDANG